VSRKARALPKKRKLRVSAAARSARKPAASARKPKESTTEIVFSYGEIDFLRKITKKEFEPFPPGERAARLSLRDKLLDIDFSRPTAGGGGLIVLELARAEVDFLQRITKEVYSFITAEERRARLILREKILIAVEKVTGKRVQPEESAE
jgi:hypothetical protein